MKTKNDPYGLKCKISPKQIFQLRGSQKGGGSAIWEKFPKFLELPPKDIHIFTGKWYQKAIIMSQKIAVFVTSEER